MNPSTHRPSLREIYHGYRDPARPYSIVVRYGTHGDVRERTEAMLRREALGPFATKAEAVVARSELDPALRPYTDISQFGGYV